MRDLILPWLMRMAASRFLALGLIGVLAASLGCGGDVAVQAPLPDGDQVEFGGRTTAGWLAQYEIPELSAPLKAELARAPSIVRPDPAAAPDLFRAVASDSPARPFAEGVLGKFLAEDIKPPLQVLSSRLEHKDVLVRTWAIALLKLHGAAAEPHLGQVTRALGIEEPSPAERYMALAAIETLGAIGPPALPALGSELSHADEERRTAAGRAMASMGEAALGALTRRLEDELIEPRLAAIQALGSMGPAAGGAIRALVRQLEEPAADEERQFLAARRPPDLTLISVTKNGDVFELWGRSSREAAFSEFIDALTSASAIVQEGRIAQVALDPAQDDSGRGDFKRSMIVTMRDGSVRRAAASRALARIVPAADLSLGETLELMRKGSPVLGIAAAEKLISMGEDAKPAVAAVKEVFGRSVLELNRLRTAIGGFERASDKNENPNALAEARRNEAFYAQFVGRLRELGARHAPGAFELHEGELLIEAASRSWEIKRYAAALRTAEAAKAAYVAVYGETHPKIAQVQTMIDAARAQSTDPR